MAHIHTDDEAVRITLRMPAGMHARVVEGARQSGRSLNAEIVHRVQLSFDIDQPVVLELTPRLREIIRQLLEETGVDLSQPPRLKKPKG